MLRSLKLLNFVILGRTTVGQVTRSYVRRVRDPGIDKRLKVFSDDFVENDLDTMEALEPDFMNVHEAHRQFEREEKRHKEKISTFIVGQKHFKEKKKGINFLTWSEKEQIRHLSEINPEEWTQDKLSQSFPADLYTIQKIIKNKWQPKDEMRVQKHDEAVKMNWKLFKKGELDVEPLLAEHLTKFAHRDFNYVAEPKVNRKLGVEIPKPMNNEFTSIITSCKKYAGDRETVKEEKTLQIEGNSSRFPENAPRDPDQDSVILEGVRKRSMKNMPLTEYQKLSPDIVTKEQTEPKTSAVETFKNLRDLKKHETGVTSLEIKDKKVIQSLQIKDQIKIPKSVWKKGQTYKVGDCFYADDGEFLYRVPGLT